MLGLVCVKRVLDYAVKARVTTNKEGVKNVDLLGVKMSMNPFCEIAVEEAVRMKEKAILNNIIAVSIGPERSQETLRQALAMGVDRALLIKTDMKIDTELQPLAVAKLLKWVVNKENIDLVLMGKQSIDSDFGQTPQILAGLLEWPQATQASNIEYIKETQRMHVSREVDTGIQKVSIPLPAVISCDLRLNTPRYATLPNLMKAKKKQLDIINMQELGIDVTPRLKYLNVEVPKPRGGGQMVASVDELLDKLRNKEKIDI